MAASIASEFHLDSMPGFLFLQTCNYRFTQPTDGKGRPSAGVRAGLISATMLGDDNSALTFWAVNPTKALNGHILFRDIDGREMKRLDFTDAYCVRYYESFVVGSSVAAYRFEIGITARQMTLDGNLHDSQWSDYLRGD